MTPRGPYRKAEDAEFLAPIRAIVDARPTYGYRRVLARIAPLIGSMRWSISVVPFWVVTSK